MSKKEFQFEEFNKNERKLSHKLKNFVLAW